jgi:hypothetical protein
LRLRWWQAPEFELVLDRFDCAGGDGGNAGESGQVVGRELDAVVDL